MNGKRIHKQKKTSCSKRSMLDKYNNNDVYFVNLFSNFIVFALIILCLGIIYILISGMIDTFFTFPFQVFSNKISLLIIYTLILLALGFFLFYVRRTQKAFTHRTLQIQKNYNNLLDIFLRSLDIRLSQIIDKKTIDRVIWLDIRQNIMQDVAHILDIERVSLWSLAGDNKSIIMEALYDKRKIYNRESLPLKQRDHPAYFQALTTNRIIDVKNAYLDPRTAGFSMDYLPRTGVTAMLDVGLDSGNGASGVLCLEATKGPRIWSPADSNFAQKLAKMITVIEGILSQNSAPPPTHLKSWPSAQQSHQRRFLSNMSHEFRTPLNAIIGYTESILTQNWAKTNIDKTVEYLHDIHRSSLDLKALIDKVLDIAAAEKTQIEYANQTFCLNALVNEQIIKNEHFSISKNIKISNNIDPELTESQKLIKADRIRTGQAIDYILENAIKFSPPCTEVIIDLTNKVDQSSTEEYYGNRLKLSITDSGPGMSDDEISTAFGHFGQNRSDIYNSDKGGIGLGLPLARFFLEQQSINLFIERQKNHNLVVTMIFPTANDINEAREMQLNLL